MLTSVRKSLALMLFVIFMANCGFWNFQIQLDHDLEHASHPSLALHGADHEHDFDDAAAPEREDGAPAESQHQLLHAVDHIQPYPAAMAAHLIVPPHDTPADVFRTPFVSAAAVESLFRPPRSTPLIG